MFAFADLLNKISHARQIGPAILVIPALLAACQKEAEIAAPQARPPGARGGARRTLAWSGAGAYRCRVPGR